MPPPDPTPEPPPLPRPPADRDLPDGFGVRLDPRVRVRAGGAVLVGGSPWGVSRLAGRAVDVVGRLVAAGARGIAVDGELTGRVARLLLDRGFALPVRRPAPPSADALVTVVPTLDRAEDLGRLLPALAGPVVVVDDGSTHPDAVAGAAARHGATVVRHARNRGPAAARNTGLRATAQPFVAFADSDVRSPHGWASDLLGHFDDPAVAMVAPRVRAVDAGDSLLGRYERAHSALDMGPDPELVRPGSRLGFVPSAAIVVRRSALGESGFDERLRLGEDVDLAWRLAAAGWLVRYDPTVQVGHVSRADARGWIVQRFAYGTSAADLEVRHPGRLAPARVSSWNLAAWLLLSRGRPVAAAATTAGAAVLLHRRLRHLPDAPGLAARTVLQGLVADGAAIGHLLRREWWPVGAVALAAAPRSRLARAAAAAMLLPLAHEWVTRRPALDPVRYAALRLVDDAAYGSGVIASCAAHRTVRPLLPVVRLPGRSDPRPPTRGDRGSPDDQRSSAPPSTGRPMPVM